MFKILYKEFGENPFTIPDYKTVDHIPKGKELTLVCWNVYKFNKKDSRQDLKVLSNMHDFMCLQEVVYGPNDFDYFKHEIGLSWNFTFSFFRSFRNKIKSGVASGFLYNSIETGYVESIPKVPIIHAPKMAISTKHEIEGGSEILILNAHLINFVWNKKFNKHLMQLADLIKDHEGPVIFAGDFNTWSPYRIKRLLEVTKDLGLGETKIENESRIKKFDHIFSRGVDVKGYRLLDEIKSSDHMPVEFEFIIK